VAGYTTMVYRDTVTHPSINRARRSQTTPLSQATTSTAASFYSLVGSSDL